MNKQNKAYILPHTHWDREWRYPIWKNRMLLIRFMDELLDILDTDENYRCFLMDGQVVPILDYLEVMPQNKEKICRYIKQGKIAVGPWYTLPDLYPVDGECLIRNLLWGKRTAGDLGGCLDIGYNSFGWGQTAQFPQIYAGFGIDFIICAKRVSEERAPESEFIWQSPDGTKILTSRLGEYARANFYFHTYLYAKYGVNCVSSDFRYNPELSGVAIHSASPDRKDEDFFVINPKYDYDKKQLAESFNDSWHATEATVLKEQRLFLNGTDFSTPQRQMSAMLADLNEQFTDTEFIHCRLDEYANALRENLDINLLRVIEGELRDGPAGECSGNALASRCYLKIANKRAQNILLRQAEPISSVLWAIGGEYPTGMLNNAWDYMLKSHPHDSINGVTQDKTADDVEYRLAQAIEIGQVVFDEGVSKIAKRLDLSDYDPNAMLLLVVNPHPYTIRDTVRISIATSRSESVWDIVIKDTQGAIMPLQEVAREEKAYPVHDMEARPWPFHTHRHLCYADIGELPPLGYKVFEICPKTHFGPEQFYWLPMRRVEPENILRSNNVLENQYLRAEFNHNGTVRLTHKDSGKIYENMHFFEDSGDVGNYWAYYPPYHNQVHTTLSVNARIWAEDNGPLSATIAVEYALTVPKSAEESVYGVCGKGKRCNETVDLIITSRFTLSRYSKRLEVCTKLKNNAMHHRLRVAFPTGIQAEFADAEGHFTVDRRPKINQPAMDGTFWPEMQTLPMQRFVDISDGESGLAVLNSCLTEYEFSGDENATLYLTLFRAMGNMIVTWWEAVGQFENQSGSQVQRELEFKYAIYPHIGDWKTAEVYREAETFNVKPASYQMCGNAVGDLPPVKSFLEISNPNIILSALKLSETGDSLTLRLFNPTDSIQKAEIITALPIKTIWECRLDETRLAQKEFSRTDLFITCAPGEIKTFELIISFDTVRF
jgi:mannosylglycerate hydrolase